ncbi:2TM domain-containing protein [bacterium]|nr:2TM domain-containing protein [bacterium]MBU1753916.1 2TM domain-containing protein [bacterium]
MGIHCYRNAVLKVEKKFSFYIHLTIYLLVNSFLFFINLFTSTGEWWFYWPLFGWGIGLFFHYINTVFSLNEWLWRWKIKEVRKTLESQKRGK